MLDPVVYFTYTMVSMFRFVVGMFLTLVLVSCQAPDSSDTLVLRLGAEPSLLNPLLSTDSPSSSVNGYVFNGLLKVNPDMSLVPDLAASYSVSDDGKIFRFLLKKNVTWHDGTPFTAADVIFTYNTLLDPKTNTVRRSDYVIDGKAVEFIAINDYEVELRLPSPFAPLLNRLTMGIIAKHLFEDEDINTSALNRNPVGTGPFVFSRWESAQFVMLTRNDDYFDAPAKLSQILLKIIPDSNTGLLAFEKEEVLSSGIPGKEFERLLEDERFQMFRFYDLAYTYLGFNLKHPFFSITEVRQALSMGIHKDAIVSGLLRGYGKAAHLPTSPELWTYPESPFSFAYDPDRAKEILSGLGFFLNKKTGVLERDGLPFSFKIITNKGNKDREKAAELIQRDLRVLGIDVSIQLMEWSSFISIVNAVQDPKDYDAVILGWSLGLDPDGYSIWHSSQYPKGFNFLGYQDDRVDALLEQGRVTLDRDKRKEIYGELYGIIARDVPVAFLYYPESLVGFHRRVKGLSPAGPAGLMNPVESIYLSAQ